MILQIFIVFIFVIMLLIYFISFHDYHRATGDFQHFPLYLVPDIATLEIGREIKRTITLHIN